MDNQTTLSRSSECVTGLQLDQELYSAVKFHPGPPDSGIVFIRSDLPNNPPVKCCLQNVRKESRWTSLVQDTVWIHHTEHILAAIFGAAIDNVLIEVNSDRIPVVSGGSCADFYAALVRAGKKKYDVPRQVLMLKEPVYHEAKLDTPAGQSEITTANLKRYILGMPAPSFSVSYVFHVPHIDKMPVGLAEYYASGDSFAENIGKARSYFLQCESAQLETRLSRTQEGFIVLTAQSENSVVNEVAQHKLLDFIGDLMVVGLPIVGRFVAFRSGHQHHHEFIRCMMNSGRIQLTILG